MEEKKDVRPALPSSRRKDTKILAKEEVPRGEPPHDKGKEKEKKAKGEGTKTDGRMGKRRKTRAGVPEPQYAEASPRSQLQQMKDDFEIWLERNLPTQNVKAIEYIGVVKAMSLEDCMVQFATIVAPLREWNGPHYCAQQVYDTCDMDRKKDVTDEQHQMLVWFIDHLCDAAILLK